VDLNQKQREVIIVKHAYLVKQIAGRLAMRFPSSVILDELISAGCLGLIDAVDKYDRSREVSLTIYAEFRIKGSILDELRNLDWYPRSMRKKNRDIEKAIIRVESKKGGMAEGWEIAEEMGISLEKYFKNLSDFHDTTLFSMDEYIKSQHLEASSEKTFQELIISKEDSSAHLFRKELKQVIAGAIKTLSRKEQLVISLYYHDELTLNEIGGVLKLTESRISQIRSEALIKLKKKLMLYYRC